MMNYPGVLNGDSGVLDKVKLVEIQRLVCDGHAPGLSGKDLNAYIAVGVHSDHESVTAEEAIEKIRLGMWLMVREGSVERNLKALLPVIKEHNPLRCMLVTDDRYPGDLLSEGDMDHCVRTAIRGGLPPIKAIQMVTINPAQYFHFRDIGAVAPGYVADIITVNDLEEIDVDLVIKRGRLIARRGEPLFGVGPVDYSTALNTVHVKSISETAFRIPGKPGPMRIIGLIPQQIVTDLIWEEAPLCNGEIVADPSRDLLKIAVVERHHATGNIGVGLVRGFGLQSGAFASSVGHDAHNIAVTGTNDTDMRVAVETVVEMGGGLAVTRDGQVLGTLPLGIAGLMSTLPAAEVAVRVARLEKIIRDLGGTARNPFVSLSFLPLSVIPALKLTDRGLVDVNQFKFVPLQD